jgi:hypothetical protein
LAAAGHRGGCFLGFASRRPSYLSGVFLAVLPFRLYLFAFLFFIALYARFCLLLLAFGSLWLAFVFFIVFSYLLPFSLYLAIYCLFYYILLFIAFFIIFCSSRPTITSDYF